MEVEETICQLVRAKLGEEAIAAMIQRPPKFKLEAPLAPLSEQNCLMFDFPTPRDRFPEKYDAPFYRLIVLFSLYRQRTFSTSLINQLDSFGKNSNIDKIIIWTYQEFDYETLSLLKRHNIDVIVTASLENAAAHNPVLKNFVRIPGNECTVEEEIRINEICDVIKRRLEKILHLVLGEIVAPICQTECCKMFEHRRSF